MKQLASKNSVKSNYIFISMLLKHDICLKILNDRSIFLFFFVVTSSCQVGLLFCLLRNFVKENLHGIRQFAVIDNI